ncbi:MAG: DUF933 domain-containing protein [Deltaproteobacteria bacterium]
MKVGLVGFGSSGKSSVFSALTGSPPQVGKGAIASTRVPDQRIDALADMWQPRKTTYAEIVFVDYTAGSFGRGSGALSPAILAEMRTLDVLAEVADAFSGGGEDGAIGDIASFRDELLLSDLAVVESRLGRLAKQKGDDREEALLLRCLGALEESRELRLLDLSEAENEALLGFGFLSLKPRIIVANFAESEAGGGHGGIDAQAKALGLEAVCMSAPLEYEISRLDSDGRTEFLEELGLEAVASDRFVAACYRLLDLITFLTAGEDEVRAWSIPAGTAAAVAAGKIHSDIARGFIRAEVISYRDYIELGSESACRDAGKLRVEGRNYVVADGDIVHFRFNV